MVGAYFKKTNTTHNMKKILFGLIAVLSFSLAQAQVPIRTAMTTADADTLTLSNVPSKIVSLTATYVETSGTSAGKFYFQGSVDGVAWNHIDSAKSVSDVATAQSITVAVTATIYKDYRVIFSNTSSATGSFTFTALRRSDDRVPAPEPLPMAHNKYIRSNPWTAVKP
jgi:hypothetical protein